MPDRFTREQLDAGVLTSLAIARQRRMALINGQQAPLLDLDRMKAALERRNKKRLDAFGEMPVLPPLSGPTLSQNRGSNGNEGR